MTRPGEVQVGGRAAQSGSAGKPARQMVAHDRIRLNGPPEGVPHGAPFAFQGQRPDSISLR